MTGFAILGTGMVADYHRQAIAANATLGAKLIAVSHHQPTEDIAQRFAVPCLTFEAVLEHPEVDVVCICTPSGQHAEQAVRAMQAGKHVLVEKPMALNLADADRMIQVSQEQGLHLGVVLQRRSEPVFKQVKEALAHDLGDISLAAITMPYYRPQSYYDQASWRGTWALDGGGVLMNQGIHLIDLLVWYLGDPVEVQAHAATLKRDIEVEDTLSASLRFASGALATITATTTSAPGFPHRLEFYGTNGGIQIEGETIRRWQLHDDSQAKIAIPNVQETNDAGSAGDPRGISTSGHSNIVHDFLQALQKGQPLQIDGHEGRRSLAAVLAIYQAAGLIGSSTANSKP